MLVIRNKEETLDRILESLQKLNKKQIEDFYWILSMTPGSCLTDYPGDGPSEDKDNEDRFYFYRKDGLE